MTAFGKPWTMEQLSELLKKRPEARIPAHTPSKPVKTPTRANMEHSQPSVEQPKANKKVRNAQKIVDEKGRKFDSRLELTMAQALDAAKISYEFQHTYILQEGFRYNGAAVRPMTLTVDFLLPQFNIIIDSKGWSNDVAPVKYKLLKRKLLTEGTPHDIRMPRNRRECDALILELLGKR